MNHFNFATQNCQLMIGCASCLVKMEESDWEKKKDKGFGEPHSGCVQYSPMGMKEEELCVLLTWDSPES